MLKKLLLSLSFLMAPSAFCAPVIMSFWSDAARYATHYTMPGALLPDGTIAKNQDFLDKIADLTLLSYGQFQVDQNGFVQVNDPHVDLSAKDTNFCKQHLEICASTINSTPFSGSLRAFSTLSSPNPLLKTLSIGGSNSQKTMTTIFEHPIHFVSSIQSLLTYFHLNGVDIDFELYRLYTQQEGQHYAALIHQLRTRLGKKAIITIEVDPDLVTMWSIGRKNWHKMAQDATYFDVMCYGIHYPPYAKKTGFDGNLFDDPNAPFLGDYLSESCNLAIKALAGSGVPMQHILLGMPMFVQTYSHVLNTNHGLYQAYRNAVSNQANAPKLTYKDAIHRIKQQHFSVQDVHVNHYTIGTDAYQPSTQTWYTYESVSTVASKAHYIRQQGLAGAEFWIISQDLPVSDPKSLLRTLSLKLKIDEPSLRKNK